MKKIFVIFFVGLSGVPFFGNALSHDEKVQKISHSYMALKNVVASLIRVDSELQETLSGADDDISTLSDSKTRNEFEVRVMNVEDAKMRADASKRTLTAEEIQDASSRREAIDTANQLVEDLGVKIEEVKKKMLHVHDITEGFTLNDKYLQNLQEQANEGSDLHDDIVLPKTGEIKANVDKEISNMQEVIETVADGNMRSKASDLKDNIKKRFHILLDNESQQTKNKRMQTAKEIDVMLLQFRDLDIYGASSRMEL